MAMSFCLTVHLPSAKEEVNAFARVCLSVSTITQQELSYRKQIARQLRTQYVEGIYRPKYYTVTSKCGLEVTEGH